MTEPTTAHTSVWKAQEPNVIPKEPISVFANIFVFVSILIQLFYIISILYIGFVARTADPIHAFTLTLPLIAIFILKRHTA